ncbi:MAG: hypothetical protein JRH17_22715 [Deltaproteobacteria bacterium]|nr:hypothetical protein [Deltaproteobacteria bacterium]
MTARRTSARGAEANPPRSVEEALAHATGHARNAVSESLLAARSLIDALSLALSGQPVDASVSTHSGPHAALVSLAQAIDRLAERARGTDTSLPRSVAEALIDALESEIGRWEQRSTSDADARAVLRAFLGLREILWELGVRPSNGADDETIRDEDDSGEPTAHSETDRRMDEPRPPRPHKRRGKPPKRPRVQRIQVDG